MSDTNSKLHLRKWQNRINRLSYGELENIIATPDIYNPDYWELAKKRLHITTLTSTNNIYAYIAQHIFCIALLSQI